jgi:glycerol-3-phosphate dehydrogenase
MQRKNLTAKISNHSQWDVCIIGGGATGLGLAVDAASRGYNTILVERDDFAKGTSSRSTKLVHGGVRYLQQGNIKLVMEALKERGILKKNAGHLVKNQSFIVPNYKWWEGPYYGVGLKIYDWMSGSLGLGPSEFLSKEEVLKHAPTLGQQGLRGGILYRDGQFDDARLAINLAQTAVEQGALVLNYFEVTRLLKSNDKICGVEVIDRISKERSEILAKVVINATGVFSDKIQQMDEAEKENTITPSQGIHIVLDKEFLPGDAAIMVPHTDDGRVLFAVPWHNKVIVGTTDTIVPKIFAEPVPLEEEITFLVRHIKRYLSKEPGYDDIRSVFAGLRPLIKSSAKKTSEISRDHLILHSDSGLISIIGGKWTTYRKMADDVLTSVIDKNLLPKRPCVTEDLPVHGHCEGCNEDQDDYYYGTDHKFLEDLYFKNPDLHQLIHPDLPYTKGQIVHAVHHEYCMTVEDALSRRTRALLLDAKASMSAALGVAQLMQKELNETDQWMEQQLVEFTRTASQYLPQNIQNPIA